MYSAIENLTVESERLMIRPVLNTDLRAIYDMHCVDEVNRYLPYNTWQDWDAAKDWFARVQHRRLEESAQQYVLERLRDKKVIGSCLVFNFNDVDKSLEFGYVLSKEVWGQGYMIEAMTELLATLKFKPGVKSVRACIERENLASFGLLNKLGFNKTSVKIEDGGTQLDVYHLAL